MAYCLDVAALYQEVVLDEREDVLQYGQSSFQTLLDFKKKCSKQLRLAIFYSMINTRSGRSDV